MQFVINYEEGGENCVLHGDKTSEHLLSEIVGATPYENVRHMNMESIYEYGSRAGFWRLYRLFTRKLLPCTGILNLHSCLIVWLRCALVYAVGMALERNPEAARAMAEAKWEIASHGHRWIDYQFVSEDEEREHIRKTIAIHEKLFGERPLGIYQGKPNANTRRLVIEEGGFLYDSDSYADDLPYRDLHTDKPHLIIPYTLTNNDMRFVCAQGFNCGDQSYTYLKDTFDYLYAEGKRGQPKMMSVGLHGRVVGQPGKIAALERFIDYIRSKERVWICKRIDFARHWYEHHYPSNH